MKNGSVSIQAWDLPWVEDVILTSLALDEHLALAHKLLLSPPLWPSFPSGLLIVELVINVLKLEL